MPRGTILKRPDENGSRRCIELILWILIVTPASWATSWRAKRDAFSTKPCARYPGQDQMRTHQPAMLRLLERTFNRVIQDDLGPSRSSPTLPADHRWECQSDPRGSHDRKTKSQMASSPRRTLRVGVVSISILPLGLDLEVGGRRRCSSTGFRAAIS